MRPSFHQNAAFLSCSEWGGGGLPAPFCELLVSEEEFCFPGEGRSWRTYSRSDSGPERCTYESHC